MSILFLISGWQVPSSRFRILQYLPYLRERGHECRVAASFPAKYQCLPALGWKASACILRLARWWDLLRAYVDRADAIVVEREILDADTHFFERQFRKVTRKLILDVDDGIFLKYPEKFDALARAADRVIVGNRLLEERVVPVNRETVLIPTCVDTGRYPLKEAGDASQGPPVIGWTGTASNLHYLKLAEEPLRALAARSSFELRIIAENDEPLQSLDLAGVQVRFQKWEEATEIADLLSFDIGIMPLPDEEWERYKCGLKAIQYMAIGIPCVASAVGANVEIVQHSHNGFLAKSPEDWENLLDRLIQEPEHRSQIGGSARRSVEERYAVKKYVPVFEEAVCR